MYRSQHRRNKDISIQPQPNSMQVVLPSPSQSSLSSLSSSDASTTLSSAAPNSTSNFSQSDTVSSDHISRSSPLAFSSPKHRFFLSKASARSSSPQMGQAPSQPTPPPPVESTPSRLKRVWQGRRKKSEDVTLLLSEQSATPVTTSSKGKERDVSGRSTPIPSTPVTPKSLDIQLQHNPLPFHRPDDVKRDITQLPSSLSVFNANKRQSQSPKSPKFSGSAPLPSVLSNISEPYAFKALPLIPTTPTPATSITLTNVTAPVSGNDRLTKDDIPAMRDRLDPDNKQDWRRSDCTMISHVTIRPGALSNRSSRPVSLAESSHSGHTIVPVNKRLSALITDTEFATPEESDFEDEDLIREPQSGRPSPTPSLKAIYRRSLTVNTGVGTRTKSSIFDTVITPSPARGNSTPTATESPKVPTAFPAATGNNIRGRLAAWANASTSSIDRSLPTPQRRPQPTDQPSVSQPHSFRQTAVSMTGSFAPVAAGIAIGIGKRAAEKVHRVLGGFSSSSSIHSNYSSSSSTDLHGPPSSYHGVKRPEDSPGRRSPQVIPGQFPSPKSGWRGKRGTPNAPSGTWSVASSTTSSLSDSDALSMPAGPTLGTRLREPKRNASGSPVAGGLVFGRDLDICVRETGIRLSGSDTLDVTSCVRPLEERSLPALVVRCAQHLLQWGIQEEGLFRVSGRPAHVAKLRSEFDTGADYNLMECDPGDLDPHAVASIFKAFLRELPESLLTSTLVSQFEAVMAAENAELEAAPKPGDAGKEASGLNATGSPPMPRGGFSLRKPPSLSTLAMPNFSNMRTTSSVTVEALTVLVDLLPVENKDLLLTVTELINATAARSKETKMPIGNLLLVFCPSLNMNPSLLRVLCETQSIWNGPTFRQSSPLEPNYSVDQCSIDVLALDEANSASPVAPFVYQRAVNSSGSADARSYVSALDGPIECDTRPSTPSLGSARMLPLLSSSTDSLATPSTMSDASLLSQPVSLSGRSLAGASEKPDITAPDEPVIIENIDLSLPSNLRRPVISSPVPFPASLDSNPPRTSPPARKSFALLSFPPMRSSEQTSPTTSSPPPRRTKRPSLQLLFSKRSTPSLKAATLPILDKGSPSSAPAMTTEYPTPAVSLAPPTVPLTLTTPISSSPMDLNFSVVAASADTEGSSITIPPEQTIRLVHDRRDSTTSLYSTPQETPVVDRFRRLPPILRAEDVEARIEASELPRSPSQLSLTPSLTIGFEDDDWAGSVLAAAGSEVSRTS